MALQKTITIKGISFLIEGDTEVNLGEKEVIVEKAYIKIVQISGGKESLTATLEISNSDRSIIFNKYHSFKPDLLSGDNFISQFYNHLKTLDTYADAIDC